MRLPWLTAAEVDDTSDNTCDPSDPNCRSNQSSPAELPESGLAPYKAPNAGPADTGHGAPGVGTAITPAVGGGGGTRSAPSSAPSSSSASPGGGVPSQGLTEALQRAGVDPALYPLISGFSVAEGNNPSGAPTLGFTDSQAGTSLDDHAQALSKQLQDRQSVAGPFPHGASPADQAAWMATVVGQNGVSSDWQGNAQPARSDYVDRIVQNMPPPTPAAPPRAARRHGH